MITYFNDFIRYNRTNQYGITLAVIALVVDSLFAVIVTAVVNAGGTVSFGWWATLPVLFTVLAIAHLIARPLVARKFNN